MDSSRSARGSHFQKRMVNITIAAIAVCAFVYGSVQLSCFKPSIHRSDVEVVAINGDKLTVAIGEEMFQTYPIPQLAAANAGLTARTPDLSIPGVRTVPINDEILLLQLGEGYVLASKMTNSR
jgi:hypothetical protein